VVDADKKNITHIALITHLLQHIEYHKKDEKVLLNDFSGLVYPATIINLKENLH
jgi:hypothetical protein